MGDEKDRAVKGLKGGFDSFFGHDVKMVCRFVKNEAIGAVKDQFQQDQTGFLTAGKAPDGFIDVFPTKEHAAQEAARLLVRHAILRKEIVENGLLGFKALIALGKVANLHAVANLCFTAKGRNLLKDGF